MKNKYSIFTPDTTYLWFESTGEKPGKYLKRLAILFDNLVIAPVGIGKIGKDNLDFPRNSDYLNYSTKEELKYSKELDEILLDIDDFVLDADAKDYDITSPETLWMGENNSYFIDSIINFVCEKFGKSSIDDLTKSEYEHIKMYIGQINMDYNIISTTINKYDDFSTVFSNIHKRILEATFLDSKKVDHGKVVAEMESINMIDFGSLKWDQIIELRKSGFISDFRLKIDEWLAEYKSSKNNSEFENKMRRYVEDTKFDFISQNKPNFIKTGILGLLGNLPSPIGVNPFGIYSAVQDLVQDYNQLQKYKWLYFLQEANKVQKK